jgi:hypothetical protein
VWLSQGVSVKKEPAARLTTSNRRSDGEGMTIPYALIRAQQLKLAHALHGDLNGDWINIPGPGHSSHDRSLGIRLNRRAPDGFFVNSLAGDDPEACLAHVKALLQTLPAAVPVSIEADKDLDEKMPAQARIHAALRIWHEATLTEGSIVEKYLNGRGCELPAPVVRVDALRFHACCPFGGARVPAMLALMRDVVTGEPTGILITALQDDGSAKRVFEDGTYPKRMRGISKGSAIMLGDASPVMGIAEGIETALSAQQIFKMPVWATMSAAAVASFPVITPVQHLTIFADHDPPGLEAAYKCASRYSTATVDGHIRFPDEPGTDWNDFLTTQEQRTCRS